MIRRSRSRLGCLALLSILAGTIPRTAFAIPLLPGPDALPSPDQSIAPACIPLVGSDGTNASAMGTFTVKVRDLGNNPMPGVFVVVDLSWAIDMHFCAEQLMPDVVMNCAAKTARLTADANGEATFTLLGGSNGAGNATTMAGGGRIYAHGILIKSPTVTAYDLDGQVGVGANDLSAWLGDFASGNPYGRSDYDCSGRVGANDLSFWLFAFGSSAQFVSCATTCP